VERLSDVSVQNAHERVGHRALWSVLPSRGGCLSPDRPGARKLLGVGGAVLWQGHDVARLQQGDRAASGFVAAGAGATNVREGGLQPLPLIAHHEVKKHR
jgi:hypothetical protein